MLQAAQSMLTMACTSRSRPSRSSSTAFSTQSTTPRGCSKSNSHNLNTSSSEFKLGPDRAGERTPLHYTVQFDEKDSELRCGDERSTIINGNRAVQRFTYECAFPYRWPINPKLRQQFMSIPFSTPVDQCLPLLNEYASKFNIEATNENVVEGYGLKAIDDIHKNTFIPSFGYFSCVQKEFVDPVNEALRDCHSERQKAFVFKRLLNDFMRKQRHNLSHPLTPIDPILAAIGDFSLFIHHPADIIPRCNSSFASPGKKNACRPNCDFGVFGDLEQRRIGLVTLRKIVKGEELRFKYPLKAEGIMDMRRSSYSPTTRVILEKCDWLPEEWRGARDAIEQGGGDGDDEDYEPKKRQRVKRSEQGCKAEAVEESRLEEKQGARGYCSPLLINIPSSSASGSSSASSSPPTTSRLTHHPTPLLRSSLMDHLSTFAATPELQPLSNIEFFKPFIDYKPIDPTGTLSDHLIAMIQITHNYYNQAPFEEDGGSHKANHSIFKAPVTRQSLLNLFTSATFIPSRPFSSSQDIASTLCSNSTPVAIFTGVPCRPNATAIQEWRGKAEQGKDRGPDEFGRFYHIMHPDEPIPLTFTGEASMNKLDVLNGCSEDDQHLLGVLESRFYAMFVSSCCTATSLHMDPASTMAYLVKGRKLWLFRLLQEVNELGLDRERCSPEDLLKCNSFGWLIQEAGMCVVFSSRVQHAVFNLGEEQVLMSKSLWHPACLADDLGFQLSNMNMSTLLSGVNTKKLKQLGKLVEQAVNSKQWKPGDHDEVVKRDVVLASCEQLLKL